MQNVVVMLAIYEIQPIYIQFQQTVSQHLLLHYSHHLKYYFT